jgi:hypothetical protein
MSLSDLITVEHPHMCRTCNNEYICTCLACNDGGTHTHTECPQCSHAQSSWPYPFCMGLKFVRWHSSD